MVKILLNILIKSPIGKSLIADLMAQLVKLLKEKIKNPAIEQHIELVAQDAINEVISLL
jgi:hypothetical protein